jgi:hypothetical protein
MRSYLLYTLLLLLHISCLPFAVVLCLLSCHLHGNGTHSNDESSHNVSSDMRDDKAHLPNMLDSSSC